MKISIISDSHDDWEGLEKAVEISNKEDCKFLLFAGDLIAPPGIAILEKFNGDVKFVWGNNEGEKVGMTRKFDSLQNIELCGDIFEGEIDGIKIFMNHYPRIVELASKSGEFDLCIHGHTHTYREEKVNNTILLNSGAIKGDNPTFAVFDTTTKEISKIAI